MSRLSVLANHNEWPTSLGTVLWAIGLTRSTCIDGLMLASVARRSQPLQIPCSFHAPDYYLYRVRGTLNSVPGNARHNDLLNSLFVDKATSIFKADINVRPTTLY